MITRALFVILGISLVACGPQKRFNRLIKKHPELVQTIEVKVKDTFIHNDTFFYPGFVDSFYMPGDTIIENDTLWIERAGPQIKVKIKPQILTKTDTIIREITVPGKLITITKKQPITTILGSIILILLLLLMLAMATKKK